MKCKTVVSMDGSTAQCQIINPAERNSPPKNFTFDSVYFVDSTAETIYNDIVYPLVEVCSVLDQHRENHEICRSLCTYLVLVGDNIYFRLFRMSWRAITGRFLHTVKRVQERRSLCRDQIRFQLNVVSFQGHSITFSKQLLPVKTLNFWFTPLTSRYS